VTYYLSLGSNLGQRARNLARARRLLGERGATVIDASSIYETEPVDRADQPWFLNQVVRVETRLGPADLLGVAKAIEAALKRVPAGDKGPRTIDIDILIGENIILDAPGLTVPHPRLHRRNFVLVPLEEIAPDLVHPVLGKSIRELAAASADPARVERSGGRPAQNASTKCSRR
jgi:2-amino-4-hydroxy-6-hydroxymethyldihydropteridine diphosphokinase